MKGRFSRTLTLLDAGLFKFLTLFFGNLCSATETAFTVYTTILR